MQRKKKKLSKKQKRNLKRDHETLAAKGIQLNRPSSRRDRAARSPVRHGGSSSVAIEGALQPTQHAVRATPQKKAGIRSMNYFPFQIAERRSDIPLKI